MYESVYETYLNLFGWSRLAGPEPNSSLVKRVHTALMSTSSSSSSLSVYEQRPSSAPTSIFQSRVIDLVLFGGGSLRHVGGGTQRIAGWMASVGNWMIGASIMGLVGNGGRVVSWVRISRHISLFLVVGDWTMRGIDDGRWQVLMTVLDGFVIIESGWVRNDKEGREKRMGKKS